MNQSQKIGLLIVVVIIILGLVWWKQNQQPTSVSSQDPIKIGLPTILSGDFAAAGENMVNSAQLAVDEINNKGGVKGQQLKLIVEDAKCDSKTGLSAASKLVNVDQVKYIVGGTCSNGTLAAAPLVNEKKVLYLTPVTGGSNVDEAGEYVFRTSSSDILAGRDIANAMIKMGYKRVGVLAESTEYTIDIKKTFESRIKEQGGTIVISEEFQPGTTDFRTIISKLRDTQSQAILVLSQIGTPGGYFIKQTHELNLNVPIFSDFTFVTNENAKKIAGSFEGLYFADPTYDDKSPEWQKFLSDYKTKYQKDPLIPFHAASTYDATYMLAKAIDAVGDDNEKVHDWILANVKNWSGLMGTYSLDAKGNSDLGFTIKVIKNGQPTAL